MGKIVLLEEISIHSGPYTYIKILRDRTLCKTVKFFVKRNPEYQENHVLVREGQKYFYRSTFIFYKPLPFICSL